MNALSVDAIIDRMKSAMDCETDSDLARRLGLHKMTVSSWRSRESTPFETCFEVSQNYGVSMDYLLTGQPPAVTSQTTPPAPPAGDSFGGRYTVAEIGDLEFIWACELEEAKANQKMARDMVHSAHELFTRATMRRRLATSALAAINIQKVRNV